MSKDLTLDLLNELFEIKDSKLIWKVSRGRIKIGDDAGGFANTGYLLTRINGKKYYNHRLLYMMYRSTNIPLGLQVDHIDGNRANNSKDNLRLVTHQENHFNRTTAKGYSWNKKTKKWHSQIKIDGKSKNLGCYDNKEDARSAYLEAKKKLHRIA